MNLKYLVEPFELTDMPLWFHKAGLSQTASGYGRKLTSARCVRLPGEKRWRRVYVTQFSNCGTAWVLIKGEQFIVRDFNGTEVSA
jgi:hypothetical protein